jgi:hypothetical protein
MGKYTEYLKTCQLYTVSLHVHQLLFRALISWFTAVDMRDSVVPAQKTIDLQKLFNNSQLLGHDEG